MKYTDLKKTGLFILMLCLHGTLLAAEANHTDPPRIIMLLGRFHPVLLHLPIGALMITFYLDLIGRIRKDYHRASVTYGLGFSAFFAVISGILGYFLSLEGGYEGETLDTHLWLGIGTAVLTSFLFVLIKLDQKWSRMIFFPVFLITLTTVAITGHFGSMLTHGDDFLTEYMVPAPKQRTIEQVDSLKIYDDVIARIFDDKCLQCHNQTKRKNGLSLASEEMILKGGDNGEVVIKNKAGESAIYNNAFLPLADDQHMPPKGKKQLTKKELWLIKYWIDHDLEFEAAVSDLPENDSLRVLLKDYLVFEQKNIPMASASDIEMARKSGFRVRSLVQGEAGLSLKYLNANFNGKALDALMDLKKQVIELDLSNVDLKDEMTTSFGKFANLEKLRLDNTAITDQTLERLQNLENLKVLNIHNTAVSGSGLERLLNSVVPERIFIWNTDVNKDRAEELADQFQTEISTGVFEGFIEKAALKAPLMLTEESLFTDALSVELGVEMKGALIRYTLDGSDPDSTSSVYKAPLKIDDDLTIRARAYKDGWYPSEVLQRNFYKVRHQVKDFSIVEEPEIRYPGSSKLFDLKEGSLAFKDGRWTGFLGYDLNTSVDLGSEKQIDKISINCLENVGNWIMLPTRLELYASLEKDKGFQKVGEVKIKRDDGSKEPIVKRFTLEVPETKGRYFKIIVRNPGVLPPWHDGAGQASWIFVDEIILW